MALLHMQTKTMPTVAMVGCKIFILAKSILLNQFAKFVEKNGFAFGKLEWITFPWLMHGSTTYANKNHANSR